MATENSATDGNASVQKSPFASVPQIYASFAASSYHLALGLSVSYSAILIPQIQDEYDAANGSIPMDKETASWVASVLSFANFGSAIAAAAIVDTLGRTNSVKAAAVPNVIGWLMIAVANNLPMLIAGRIMSGLTQGWATTAAGSFIAEVTSPTLRGSLSSLLSFNMSIGMLLSYVFGAFLHWRTVAWISAGISMLPFFTLAMVPDSYSYLIMKERYDKALMSIHWFYRFESPEVAEKIFNDTRERSLAKKLKGEQEEGSKWKKAIKKYMKPTFVKPYCIVAGLLFFQHFTGIFMTLFYAVIFIRDIGTNLNPYTTSIYFGVTRVIVSVANIWLLRLFPRRYLLLLSTFGMAVCIFVAATVTIWIHKGVMELKWVAIGGIVGYIMFAMMGLLPLPFIYAAELYALEVRSVSQSMSILLHYVLMFIAIKMYFKLHDCLGGIVGLQYYFCVMSLASFLYVLVLIPETHKKKLDEIEDYFENNTIYLSLKCKKKSNRDETESVPS